MSIARDLRKMHLNTSHPKEKGGRMMGGWINNREGLRLVPNVDTVWGLCGMASGHRGTPTP